jgi:3-phenylpropionate/trans-cinnamate dioxygenase ferredoxin reductase subunit
MRLETVVVVGASLAGLRSVEALRSQGYEGRLVWIGAELELPYDRPPLSKEVLRGEWGPERTALRKEASYAELRVELRPGVRAEALDLRGRAVVLAGGERVAFDGLVVATGAAPRRLPRWPDHPGLFVLRTLEDALAIRRELERRPRVAVIGAGFIGAEVAASARSLGLDVAMIDVLDRPMARALDAEIGAACAALHRDHGVDLHLGVGIAGFEGERGVGAVTLASGARIAADLVVVGIGVAPETAWLAGSGLALSDGVLCDATLAASAPGVVAAGDVARWRHPGYAEPVRAEHWTNAVESAGAAARRLLAGDAELPPFAPVSFVWSDQYDAKLQIAGHATGGDETAIVHGSLAERRFVKLYGTHGRLTGAFAMNRPRQLVAARRWIREGLSFADALARAGA